MNLSYKELIEEARPEKGQDILNTYWGDKERRNRGTEIARDKKGMFNIWMMTTNAIIMSGVWLTLICLLTGII